MIIINLVLTIFPITRNFTLFFKIIYNEITSFHIFLAIMCLITTLIKFIVVLVYYPLSFLFNPINELTGGSTISGTLAAFGIFLISIFAIKPIRKNCYEVFYITHKIFLLFIIITSIQHYNIISYYFIPLFIGYIFDIILRIKKTYNCEYAKINIIKNYKNEYSIINLTTKKNINIFPGCYFMICFIKISKIEWHPFSLASAKSINNNNTYTFCAKNNSTGSWVNQLEKYVDIGIKKGDILIQGPYGYVTHQYFSNNYKYFIAVIGGVGITSLFSIIDHIKELIYLQKLNNLEKIKIIWILNDEILFNYFKKELLSYSHEIFDIEIYIVQSTQINQINQIHDVKNTVIKNYKPNVLKILNSYTYNKDNIFIFSSGPQKLIKDMKKFCSIKQIYLSIPEY